MGFTGLARWINAPTTGLDAVKQTIVRNNGGIEVGRWSLGIRSYRSTFSMVNGVPVADRSLCVLTMNNYAFAFLEDPSVPTHAEFLQAQALVAEGAGGSDQGSMAFQLTEPPHYRHTFLTLHPSGGLEQLLAQLRAKWQSTRQQPIANQGAVAQNRQPGFQLVVEGHIFTVGTDWLVRVGNVILAGGAVKGMLLEAEYLPSPVLRSQDPSATPELLSNLLTSILPNIPDARTVAVTISDAQWEEVLWSSAEHEAEDELKANAAQFDSLSSEDDIFVYENEETAKDTKQKGDWTGLDRDRRSAFLIIGALRSEGVL